MNRFTIFLAIGLVTLSNYYVSADFSTDEKFGEMKFSDKSVNNDVWGPGAGHQHLTAQSGSQWCANCSHGDTGGIKAYPHTMHEIKKPLSSIKQLQASFAATVQTPPGGTLAYSFTFDIWLQKNQYEIMLWMEYKGKVGPLGSMFKDNVSLGGYTWKVYKGDNGGNQVFSFLNQKPTLSGKIDLKAIIDWIDEQKWFAAGQATVLGEIQLGFEITSTPPNSKFCLTDYNPISS